MRFLPRLATNFAIFLAFFGVLWPVADLGLAWEPRSAGFVALSAATAGLFFAIFDERRTATAPGQQPVRRGLAFLSGFFSLLGVLAVGAAWTVGLLVWRYGETQVLAADGTREIIGGAIAAVMLSLWYGLDRAFYPRGRQAERQAADDLD